jgi:hypothetical protein
MGESNPDFAFDERRQSFVAGRPHDYSALKAPSPDAEGSPQGQAAVADGAESKVATLAANRQEIGAFMGVDPSGTVIYTGQAHGRTAVTDYANGPRRPDAAESAKRQRTEVPGADNIDDGRVGTPEPAQQMSAREQQAARLAGYAAEIEADAAKARDAGSHGHEAAFRSFGR